MSVSTTLDQSNNFPVSLVSASDRNWAVAAHLAAFFAAILTSWVAGFAGAAAAFVVWLLVKNTSRFAADHAKEAINFNLSMFIYAVVLVVIVGLTLGVGLIIAIPAWACLAIAWVICSISATIRASNGELYRYPISIRLFN